MQEEIVIEIKVCKHCSVSFDITNKDLEFYDKVSPVFGWVKYNISSPTFCPDCRQQRRLSFRNERNLYHTKSDLSWKNLISVYSPDKNYKVYSQDEWWSDKWNPLNYWREFDFNRSFFEQFEELFKTVPKVNIFWFGNDNCDYTNYLWNSKNSYLTVAWVEMENILYSFWIANSKNCMDCYKSFDWENLFECIDCKNCNNSVRLYGCQDCSDSYFLKNCIWCKDCIGCINLINKQYFIENKQYSKEDYFKVKSELKTNKIYDFPNKISKNLNNISCENCIWDYLINCKNVSYSYDSQEMNNCKFLYFWWNMSYCYDIDYDSWTSYCLEWLTWFKVSSSSFMNYCNESSFLYYCSNCFSSNNCFGCDWLRNASYCIFNRQYTKEEYEILVPRIIEYMRTTWEWWEFFPTSISPFWYNETVANEYFPISKELSIWKWFKWSDYENPAPVVSKTIPALKLLENIKDIPDDILNWAILCEITNKPFRIIKPELEFYRKHNLPIPRSHPDQRHLDRMKLRNPRKLYDRVCDKCWIDMKTTYSHEREEIVYCEDCYNKEVY
ncbi:MAG: hypothetical protein ACD_4C00250G0006 [uncultured bacterium (gcode 4)]|uniref:Uncharacterized protein n=1 Tax=uncultured bacterium (gcode 4) TaxID=1234023 RepID=K2G8T4_9BACT|nr:MAG: hypothetical protein ACD_4C00250G0006 [uncultured bacterium (gcode 4)]